MYVNQTEACLSILVFILNCKIAIFSERRLAELNIIINKLNTHNTIQQNTIITAQDKFTPRFLDVTGVYICVCITSNHITSHHMICEFASCTHTHTPCTHTHQKRAHTPVLKLHKYCAIMQVSATIMQVSATIMQVSATTM